MTKNNLIQFNWLRAYFLQTEMRRLLLVPVMFGFLLLLIRMVYTGHLTFLFLVWNLFLAFIPYFLSYTLTLQPAWIKSKWKLAIVVFVWLLFVPNSFYMLTDLCHLYDGHSLPFWYDLLLIFCFAWNALLMGILSVRHMEKITKAIWKWKQDLVFVYPVMVLNAFGIYIGRYLRYNSWDVISNPFHLMADTCHILLHPVACKNAWAMVLILSFFLSIVYMTLKKLNRSV